MIILERAAILLLLFLSFNQRLSKENFVNVNSLLQMVHQNVLIYIDIKIKSESMKDDKVFKKKKKKSSFSSFSFSIGFS